MTFASTDFLWLMGLTFAIYWVLPRRAQNVLLIGVSLTFYGWIHPWWVLLLLYSAALDFSCGLGMVRWPARKRVFLWLSICGNLALLGSFKYFGFFVDEATALLAHVGLRPMVSTLEVLLPVGISFYTFQSMSYSVDVYRGKGTVCRDSVSFLLFVSFFPQLVMGPIGRARLMLPQIAAPRQLTSEGVRSGLSLAMWGAFKKIVIADTLSGFVHSVFSQAYPSWFMVWSAAAAASVMMYADFSGYTDIARGCARLLGFELPRNFDAPYLSRTPAEWFKRWHMSFYGWMGEYVFQPVVLTRWCRRWLVVPFVKPTPSVHVVRGVMVTFMLSGLWHGAAWSYIVWGAYMGAIQLVYYFVARKLPSEVRNWHHASWIQRPLMVAFVCTGELLFQVRDVGRVGTFLRLHPLGGSADQWMAGAVVLAVLGGCALPMVAVWWVGSRYGERLTSHPAYLPLQTSSWCLLGWMISIFYRGASSDFAYFQF